MKKDIELAQAMPLIEEMLLVNSEVAFSPSGTSMMPLLRNRKDKIVLRKVSGKLKKYDVPLYRRSNGAFVLHRVVGIRSDGYVMCGDNQTVKEYCIKDDCIIAVMSSFYRDGKHVDCNSFLYKLYSRFWVISMPVRRLYRRAKSLIVRIRRKLFGK